MTERLELAAYGHRITLVAPEDGLQLAHERLPPTYVEDGGASERTWSVTASDGGWNLAVDGTPGRSWATLEDGIEAALSDLELWVGEKAEGVIFVHAGCVVFGGQAVLLPGFTMAGKTSLTLALVAAGATYFSDEFAVLDADGLVHPYRRRPSVRSPTQKRSRPELPSVASADPVPVGLTALLRYVPDVGWDTAPLTTAQGLLGVLEHTLAARSRTLEALRTLERACSHAPIIKGTRGQVEEAAARLLDLLDDG